MITLERTVTTDAPIDAVFAYLSDFTTTEKWDPGTVSTKRVSGDGGVGTQYRNVSRFMGRESTIRYAVRQLTEPTLIQLRGENDSLVVTDTMRLTAAGTGTRVVYRAEFRFQGIARWLEPLLRLPLKKLGDDAEKGMTQALAGLRSATG